MAKKNKIDKKYYLLDSETFKVENNHNAETASLAPDDLAVR
jgi:hypothetical protein